MTNRMTNSLLMAAQKIHRFTMITIVLPVGSNMPVIPGKWERLPDGQIRARYTPDEYSRCLTVFEAIRDAKETQV